VPHHAVSERRRFCQRRVVKSYARHRVSATRLICRRTGYPYATVLSTSLRSVDVEA